VCPEDLSRWTTGKRETMLKVINNRTNSVPEINPLINSYSPVKS
jgi:hypothetical protein